MTVVEEDIVIHSVPLQREAILTLFMPVHYDHSEPLNLLLLNDGQETENLNLKETLQNLYGSNLIKPVLVIALHAGEDRLHIYGTAGKPDYKLRGSKAADYSRFITTEVLPVIKKETGIDHFGITAFAGFSLGGLSAMDIAWNHHLHFNRVGVFSGSFWWRSKELGKGYSDKYRIMHSIIRDSAHKPNLQFWLQTGTNDETADRNKNGVIDSIDDTLDIIKELKDKGYSHPGDIHYHEVVDGTHHTSTWAEALPEFLVWAFGR
ncbi:MAG: alpha/beta hydrolase-fold protein [Mucilaginibacter sp.]